MKIVNLIGGLGNQMFQYAFALALKQQYKDEEVKVDISHFNGYGLHNGFEIDRIFGNTLPIANRKEIARCSYYIPNYKLSRLVRKVLPKRKLEFVEKLSESYKYIPSALAAKSSEYFEGYWMSHKFFNPFKTEILRAFTFPSFDTEINRQHETLLNSRDSVTIHIRRGDYLNVPNFQGICDLEYYRKAIIAAKQTIMHPIFFIFSNDMTWCRENLSDLFGDSKVFYVDNNKGKDSYRDMQLMSLGRCNILANSSFSWWAAYLNRREDKIVYVPHKWVNNFDDTDAFVEEWNIIR